jgi:PAS domain S-box-containing protein
MPDLHKLLLENAIHAYAYHRLLTDDTGKPVDYEYLDVNPAFLSIIGLSREAVIGKKVTKIIPGIEKDEVNWIEFFGEVALTQQSKQVKQHSAVLNKWFKISVFSPEKGYFIALFDDITEETELAASQRELLKEVRLQESKFRTLIEHSPDALLLLDRNSFVDCNDAALRLMGAGSREQLIGKTPIEMSPEFQPDGSSSRVRARQIINDVYNGIDQRFEWQHTRIDGTTFYAEVILTLLPQGDESLIYTVIRDISDRYRAEAELRKINEVFRVIVNNSPDMIWIRDLNFNMVYISPTIQRLKGFTVEEAMNRRLKENVTPETFKDFINILREELALEKDPQSDKTRRRRFESDEICKDGSIIHTESIASFIRDENGTATGILGITRDITEQQGVHVQLQTARKRAEESDRLKSSFLANMSHEIRTPMNSIVGFAELLGDEDLLPDERKKYIGIIQKSSEYLLTLVSDIIDISKIEAGQMDLRLQAVNLDEMMKDLLVQLILMRDRMGKSHLGISLTACLCDLCNRVPIDPVRIKQLVINLVHNALKFTESGGITLGHEPVGEHSFRFFVRDTGPGISPEHQRIIFNRFRQGDENLTRKYGGTGLGLAICQGIVDLMGGKIGVKSETGKGSEFWFTLPIVQKPPTPPA